MSDSEEGAAFESADEETKTTEPDKSKKLSEKTTDIKSSKTKAGESKSPKKTVINKEKNKASPTVKKTMSKPNTDKLSDRDGKQTKTSPQKPKTFDTKTAAAKQSPDGESKNSKDFQSEVNKRSPVKNQETTETKSEVLPPENSKVVESDSGLREPSDSAAEKQSETGWGSWGSWGTSILSAASTSVQTLTSSVEEGFSTVLETVESSLIGPEELAQITAEEEAAARRAKAEEEESNSGDNKTSDKNTPTKKQEIDRGSTDNDNNILTENTSNADTEGATGGGWLSSWGLTKIVDDLQGATKTIVNEGFDISKDIVSGTVDVSKHIVSGGVGVGKNIMSSGVGVGKTLVTGGLDVLEALGKTTYDAIAEGEHGLKETVRGGNKPNLSKMLREAKDEAANMAKAEEENAEARKAHFGTLFDEYQGLVHLEALEMLSDQCEGKVQGLLATISPESLGAVKKELLSIKSAFEIDFESDDEDEEKEHDFEKLVKDHVNNMNIGASTRKLIQVHINSREWLRNCEEEEKAGTHAEPKEIHMKAIQTMAEMTAKSAEQFHKTGELVLSKKGDKNYTEIANNFASLTRVLCIELGILSTYFTQCLNTAANNCEDSDSVNPFITNVYLEATNSSTYIQDAFHLLLPVVQQAAVESAQS